MDWRRWRDRVSDDSSMANAVEWFVFVGFLAVMAIVLWVVADMVLAFR